ncbi:anhydro-N-acetylmuramic acid kinase [Solemya velum gill symbiont]|uniref:anhydro-N-acetylmuramic acid kinase n=1 Tax=Solemya velum gill symbiont TaxID=2340 RepID=UPI000996DA7C|nr:anhydro-N-acetylmuramic acid kinase [Solemya velum gill symbiont]OOZ52876.1 anhydro-N-acetylmuramic acid kinase [Solemya velum gill symbiont]
MPASLYIGLMSGTSMDGIDAALVSIDENEDLELLKTHSHEWPTPLHQQLEALALPGENEIDRLGEADAWAGDVLAESVIALLNKANIPTEQIRAIGSHGQTVRHRPHNQHPFTLQIGDANRIAAKTGITTVADFRRRDMAVGGQGAPLAPTFHKAVLSSPDETRVIVNIGGIANLTILPKDASIPVTGFDSGPGNRLMDDWIFRTRMEPYDNNGDWAASGNPSEKLLSMLADEPYFNQAPPKSTGTEEFNLTWLEQRGDDLVKELSPEDIQATLLELTLVTITQAVTAHAPTAERLLVCGGGAHNNTLMQRLQARLPELKTGTTAELGIDPDWVEAAAFAWLAHRTVNGLNGNLTEVTGASKSVPLGCIYPI